MIIPLFLFQKPCDLSAVRAEFSKYGPISDVKMPSKQRNSSIFKELHITYENCLDAYKAFTNNYRPPPEEEEEEEEAIPGKENSSAMEITSVIQITPAIENGSPEITNSPKNGTVPEIRNILHIMPAFTWHQPHWSPIDPIDKELPEPFSGYLYIGRGKCTQYSLSKQRQELIKYGGNRKKLHLNYIGQITNNTQYQTDDYNARATMELLSEIGEELEFLAVCRHSSVMMPPQLLDALRPAIEQITTLEWKTYADCNILQQLNELCPKLKRIKIRCQTTCNEGCSSLATLEPMRSSLKHLHFYQWNSGCANLLRAFEGHPELLSLSLSVINSNILLSITKNNLKLEFLEIYDNRNALAIDDRDMNLPLDQLKELQNLRLFVYRIHETYDLNDISAQMAQLAEASQIQASVVIRNCRARREYYSDHTTFIHSGIDVSVIENNVLEISIGNSGIFTHRIPMSAHQRYLINVIGASQSLSFRDQKLADDILTALDRNYALFDGELYYHKLHLDDNTCIYFHVASFTPEFYKNNDYEDR